MRKNFIGAAVAAAATVALGIGGPASAASFTATDPADIHEGVDLRSVRVVNGERYLTIVLTHDDLTPHPSSARGGEVYIDTDPADKGPELVLVGGYSEGAEFELLHTEGFGIAKWRGPVRRGHYEQTLDFDRDTTKVRISRRALGHVGKVRVAVKVGVDLPDEGRLQDWLGRSRSFTPWVRRG